MNETPAKEPATKSAGVTAKERMLAHFCERSFLRLWSRPATIWRQRDDSCAPSPLAFVSGTIFCSSNT
jgi:hypothetical protein